MIKGIHFQPWIPENYEKGYENYGKLLILGESHYDDTEDAKEDQQDNTEELNENSVTADVPVDNPSEFTTAVVKHFLEENVDIAFFRNLGLLFNNENKYDVWRNVAFANGIQVALSDSNAQPSAEEIQTVKKAFWLLIDHLQPDKILICSKRMWNNWMDDGNKRGMYLRNIEENGKKSTIWKYKLENKVCHAMGINHPSKYFSHLNWKPIVFKFLSEKFDQNLASFD